MESSERQHSLEFYRGLDLFKREFCYECHEVWEEIWMEAKGEKKIFYQALIMAAVSLYHFGNENLKGALSCHQKAVTKFQQLPGYYLSIDLDALDPAYAPAVGNPEPFGLTNWDVKRVVERLAPRAMGMDINELAPAYDRGETALLAARLARGFIAAKTKISQ